MNLKAAGCKILPSQVVKCKLRAEDYFLHYANKSESCEYYTLSVNSRLHPKPQSEEGFPCHLCLWLVQKYKDFELNEFYALNNYYITITHKT